MAFLFTPQSAFRPVHLEYAVEKGVNVFMEKSFAPDPGRIRRIIRAGEAAEKKNLKGIVGAIHRLDGPPDRRVLLDQGRVARLGAGRGRTHRQQS